jgi:Circularly permutated YpsA SLOG family
MTSLKIISGGQSGVDRAALDVAIERGITYGGWCPRGGWAEDFPNPPGLLARYPHLRETPSSDPAERTQWNVRDSDAVLILLDQGGLAASKGTMLARDLAQRNRKPLLVVGLDAADSAVQARQWLEQQLAACADRAFHLGIGGPRESGAPGIYGLAKRFLQERMFVG